MDFKSIKKATLSLVDAKSAVFLRSVPIYASSCAIISSELTELSATKPPKVGISSNKISNCASEYASALEGLTMR